MAPRFLNRSQKIGGILVLSTLALVSQFNACSKVGFSTKQDMASRAGGLGDPANRSGNSGAVVINSGASFTKNAAVKLTLSTASSATEMYVTNSADCASGGQWEPFSENKDWTLGETNKFTSVYAKFRSSANLDSACAKASITHDNIAPDVVVDATAPQLTNKNTISTMFHATDSGSGVDQLYCITPGQTSAMPCQGVYLGTAMADGGYMVQFLASDLAGNLSAPTKQSFTVDNTPPVVTLSSMPALLSGSVNATFEFAASDNLSGIKQVGCKLDLQNEAPCTSPWTYMALGQGQHKIVIHAYDNAGNVSDDVTYSWTIDTAAPTVQFTQTPGPYSKNSTATFAFVGSESNATPLTQFKCRLDGGAFSSCTSPDMLAGLTEGKHTFGVIGTSRFGIDSAELTYAWTVDLTLPAITLTQTPPPLTNSTSANFTFMVTDNLSGVTTVSCSLDGGTYQDCATMTALYANLKGDYQHSFQIQAVDGAGNTATSTPYYWYIDVTPPEVTIATHPDSLTSKTTAHFTLTGSDDHSATVTFQCRLDTAAAFTACDPNNISYPNLTDGTHTFYAQSKDGAGNLSATASYTWTVETVGPVITFTQTPAPSILSTDHGVLSYIVTDPVSTVTSVLCGIDSMMLTCTGLNAGTLTFPALAAGNHTFTLTATNSAGVTSIKSYTFMSHDPTCTTTLNSTKIPTKMLFVIDMSGSNQNSSTCTLGPNCTDPDKKMRGGSIQTFFNDYGTSANFSWSFDYFNGSTSKALINNGNPSMPVFSDKNAMQSAINTFMSLSDTGKTPYSAALSLANYAITNDPDLNNTANPPQYIVVFMSDGQPNGSGDTTTNILNAVQSMVNIKPGRISFNTVYYGPADQTASNLLGNMASTGNGNFLNTNINPTGLSFQISDLVNVPVTTCY